MYDNIIKDPVKAGGHARKLGFTHPRMVAELGARAHSSR